MRFVPARNCEAGMIVGKSVILQGDIVFLRRGNSIKPEHLGLMHRFNIEGVFVEDAISAEVVPDSNVDPTVHKNARGIMRQMFTKASLEKADNASLSAAVDETIDTMIDQIYDTTGNTTSISLLKDYDDYTYQHSVDVGILSIMIGKAMNLTRDQLSELGRAAFFHDTGKMFVPKEILHKPGRLTDEEFEVMRNHTTKGYEFVMNSLGLPEEIASPVLSHHEKYDGTGYPNGLAGDDIPLYSRIISVADVYDALNSKRVYKDAMIASEGYEFVMANLGTHFCPKVGMAFLRAVPPFPAGSIVKLSDGREAIIIKNEPNFMTRPKVKITKDPKLTPEEVANLPLLDLARNLDAISVTITKCM